MFACLLCFVLICFVLTLSGKGVAETLPKPSGKYAVGVAYLDFTDESRKELFDNSQQSDREITVKAWYPSDKESDPEPYFLDADFVVDHFQFPEMLRNLKTNSGRDLRLSSAMEEYPDIRPLWKNIRCWFFLTAGASIMHRIPY